MTSSPDRPLNADEEALMRALFPAFLALNRRCEVDLVREQGMSLTEYRVLMVLSETEGHRLGMSALAAACHQSVSAISRTVGRLERAGLVTREQCQTDGRSAEALLTADGLARLEAAWPTHLRSVRRALLDHFEGLDLVALTRSLTAVAAGTEAAAPTR